MRRNHARAALALAAALSTGVAAGGARAELVTFEASGEIVEVVDALDVLPDLEGVPYTASYSFDPATPDALPEDDDVGSYPQEAGRFVVSASEIELRCDDPVDYAIEVFDGVQVGGLFGDSYEVVATGCEAFDERSVVELVELDLFDTFGDALDDDDLPRTPPDPDDFDSALSVLVVLGCPASEPDCDDPVSEGFSIAATVDEIVQVPEPGPLALHAAAVLAIAGLALGRRRL